MQVPQNGRRFGSYLGPKKFPKFLFLFYNIFKLIYNVSHSFLSLFNVKRLVSGKKVHFQPIVHTLVYILQIYQWECSAEAVTPELVRQFFKIFPTGKTICNFYGSTEMSDVTYASFGSLEDFESKLDSNRYLDYIIIFLCRPKLQKSQSKKLAKSNKSISRIIFLTEFHFLQFQK